MSLSFQNKEAELSYAYLHAVSAKAGMSCKIGDRHDDGHGVDAEVNFRGITSHPYITQVQLNVQLKATTAPSGRNLNYATYYFKELSGYDKLRAEDSFIYKILVVLFLPRDTELWLTCTSDELILKKAAYWTCLYGAEASDNDTGQTIYIPRSQLLTPEELIRLANLAVSKAVPKYQRPTG